MPEKWKRRNLGPQILRWVREGEPMEFEELTRLYCKWRHDVLEPGSKGTAWRKSAQAIKLSVTYLALNGLVKVTADVPPFDGLRVLLTDKGREASRGHKGERP